MNKICIFCGACYGIQPIYREHAEQLGMLLGKAGKTVIYGGASVGLMGAVADSTLAAGGKAIGVLPDFLTAYEIKHPNIDHIMVPDLYQRKKIMLDDADAFIVLPGGLGTLDELFEIWSASQLQQYHKPIGILNTQGFYDDLLQSVQKMAEQGFINQSILNYATVANTPEALLTAMSNSKPLPSLREKFDQWKRA